MKQDDTPRTFGYLKDQPESETLDFTTSHALIIGINDYQNGIPPLRTAINDATRLAKMLEQDFGYQVRLLTESVTQETLRKVLQHDLPQTVGENDRVLFYFAGHGVALDGDDGPAGYVIPEDAQRENRDSFMAMRELHDALIALPCRHLLAIFDCCFAGAFRWSAIRDLAWMPKEIHQERYLRYIRDPAWQVLTSAAYDQQALDVAGGMALGMRDEQQNHSPFALALFQALKGDGDIIPKEGGDGLITASELYLYLRDQVENYNEELNLRQTPGLWPLRKHDKGEYLFQMPEYDFNKLKHAPELTTDNNPYRGLHPFEEKHKNLFFGRTAQIEALAEQVQNHMLTVVVGASGTGKSSLVKAGLLPYLRTQSPTAQDDADSQAQWHILPTLRPAENPAVELRKLLLRESIFTVGKAISINTQLQNWREQHPNIRLLLVIDQLEELITLCRDEKRRNEFVALLQPLIDQPNIHLVFTLRADFEPQVAKYFQTAQWNPARFTAKPMTQDELREVIEGPARERVLYFEPSELVDKLINEVIQTPGALPLLSFTLSELYIRYLECHANNRALSEEDYQQLGGVIGSLRHRANTEYEALDTAHQATMKRIMLRMIAVEGGELARRRVPRDELIYADEAENRRVEHVLNRLVGARLLVSDEGGYIEPAHDALVRAWDALENWYDAQERVLSLSLQRSLTQVAREWDAADDKNKTGLLWNNNPNLLQLEPLLVKEDVQKNHLNRCEQEFVSQSVTLRQRRQRQFWGSVTAVFVTLIVMLIIGLRLLSVANLNERIAASRELAKTSENLLQDNPELSLLIAIEAGNKAVTFEANKALRENINRYPQYLNLTNQETSDAVCAAAKPDGTLAAVGYENGSVEIWNTQNLWHEKQKQSVALLSNSNNVAVQSLSFLPNTQYLLRNASNVLDVWDLSAPKTPQQVLQINGKGTVGTHGKYLAVLGENHAPVIYSTFSWEKRLLPVEGKVLNVAFASLAENLVTVTQNRIFIWTLEHIQQPLSQIEGQFDTSILAVSPMGDMIAITTAFQSSWNWQLWRKNEEGSWTQTLSENMEDYSGGIDRIEFSHDGKHLAVSSWRRFQVWNMESEKPVQRIGHQFSLEESGMDEWSSIDFTANDQSVLVENHDSEALLVNIRTGTILRRLPTLNQRMIQGFAVADKQDWAIIVSRGGARIYDTFVEEFRYLATFSGSPDFGPPILDLSPSGHYVAYPENGTIEIYKTADWKKLGKKNSPILGLHAQFATTGNKLLVQENANTLAVYSIPDFAMMDKIVIADGIGDESYFDLDRQGHTLSLWEENGRGRVFSTTTKRWLWDSQDDLSEVYTVALDPNGEFVAAVGETPNTTDEVVMLWNLSKAEKRKLEWPQKAGEWIYKLSFAPDYGSLLLIADKGAIYYNLESSTYSAPFLPQTQTLENEGTGILHWSAQQLILARSYRDNSLWDVENVQLLSILGDNLPNFEVKGIGWSPDTQTVRILQCLNDGGHRHHFFLRTYPVGMEALLAEAKRRTSRPLTPTERQRFHLD